LYGLIDVSSAKVLARLFAALILAVPLMHGHFQVLVRLLGAAFDVSPMDQSDRLGAMGPGEGDSQVFIAILLSGFLTVVSLQIFWAKTAEVSALEPKRMFYKFSRLLVFLAAAFVVSFILLVQLQGFGVVSARAIEIGERRRLKEISQKVSRHIAQHAECPLKYCTEIEQILLSQRRIRVENLSLDSPLRNDIDVLSLQSKSPISNPIIANSYGQLMLITTNLTRASSAPRVRKLSIIASPIGSGGAVDRAVRRVEVTEFIELAE
jgi:hypothetical protein